MVRSHMVSWFLLSVALAACAHGMDMDGTDALGDTSGGSMGGAGGSSTGGKEICNGLDDDGNGEPDDIFECVLGSTGSVCITSCNTAGLQKCTAPDCTWGACQPYAENCDNTIDDDCNGLVDCADPACTANASCQPAGSGGASGAGGISGSAGAQGHAGSGGASGAGGAFGAGGVAGSTGSQPFGGASGMSGQGGNAGAGGVAMNGGATGAGGLMGCGAGGVQGAGGSSGAGSASGSAGAGSVGVMQPLHLHYAGPVMPGTIVLMAWWQPPGLAPRSWGAVTDCVDVTPGDGILDCVFQVNHQSAPLEFQINLPDGQYWGDESCSPNGGCGMTVGYATLDDTLGNDVPFVMDPENGQPYYIAHVALVP